MALLRQVRTRKSISNLMSNPPQQRISYDFDEEDLIKFAELIINDCITVGGPEDSYTDEWFKAKADSILKIKQRFGVKE